MREIKFRAWDGKRMFFAKDGTTFWDSEGAFPDDIIAAMRARGWKWMQFTGLKDKNGKEIYEGDIVRAEGQFIPERIKIGSGLEFHRDILRIYESDMAWTVIGNIYENPNLLQ